MRNPFKITILESVDKNRPLNKKITIESGGEWKKEGYQDAYLFYRYQSNELESIDQAAELIAEVSNSSHLCIVTGKPIYTNELPGDKPLPRLKHHFPGDPDKKKPECPPTLAEQDSPLLIIDIDDIEIPGADVITDPEHAAQSVADKLELGDYSFFYQFSAGQKPDSNLIRIRLFFVCSKNYSNDEYKRWAKAHSARGIPIDTAIYQAAQIIYTARPDFSGRDPIPTRHGLVLSEKDYADITIPEVAPKKIKSDFEWKDSEPDILKIRSALDCIPMLETPYEDKTAIGMALHSLGDTGLELWREWLSEWQHYSTIDKRWRTFSENEKKDLVGIGTLFYHAEKHGWNKDKVVSIQKNSLESRIDQCNNLNEEIDSFVSEIALSGMTNSAQDTLLKQISRKTGVSIAVLRKDAKLSVVDKKRSTDGWKKELSYDSNGDIYPSLMNIAVILRNDDYWKNRIKYDEFALNITLDGECWQDIQNITTTMWLEKSYKMRAKSGIVNEAVQAVARDHICHPVRNYINELKWDGVNRLDSWLHRYLGAVDNDYHRNIGSKWMIAAIARILNPGCQVDNMMILESQQGTGKTSALRILFGEKWFVESDVDIHDKDAMITMRGKWLIEMAELANVSRADANRMKAFVSRTIDTYRPPYGKIPIDVPRSCLFSGTVNPSNGGAYLSDPTGNRRYWPARVGVTDKEGLRAARDQLWAEAACRFKRGEPWWFDGDPEYVTEEQRAREHSEAWEDIIRDWLAIKSADMMRDIGIDGVTVAMVMVDALNLDPKHFTRSIEMRVANILDRLGYVRKRSSVKSVVVGHIEYKRPRVYVPGG